MSTSETGKKTRARAQYAEEIGKRIAAARYAKSLTYKQCVLGMGLPHTRGAMFCRWESGRHCPHAMYLKRIADVLGITVAHLIGE